MDRKGCVLWLTGLCASGKTTIAKGLEQELKARHRLVEVLDGDAIRMSLSRGLSYSHDDRVTNMHRIAFVANLLGRNDVIAIVAAIGPYRQTREEIRAKIDTDFIEVYLDAPLEVCESRDVKGLYAMARSGELLAFTGIDDPYEAPINPDLICHTAEETPQQSIQKILAELERRELIPPKPQVEFFI
jgi:adenylylsulfate kinase